MREIPRAPATGLPDLRPESQAVRITHDDAGRADGVEYLDSGGNLHKQAARVVCVAGNPIANVHLDDHPDDVAVREHGYARADLLYEAVGALSVHHAANPTLTIVAPAARQADHILAEPKAGTL